MAGRRLLAFLPPGLAARPAGQRRGWRSAACWRPAAARLAVSEDPRHLVALVGCEDLIVVHTPLATLVCRKDQAERVKQLAALAAERFGTEYA